MVRVVAEGPRNQEAKAQIVEPHIDAGIERAQLDPELGQRRAGVADAVQVLVGPGFPEGPHVVRQLVAAVAAVTNRLISGLGRQHPRFHGVVGAFDAGHVD